MKTLLKILRNIGLMVALFAMVVVGESNAQLDVDPQRVMEIIMEVAGDDFKRKPVRTH